MSKFQLFVLCRNWQALEDSEPPPIAVVASSGDTKKNKIYFGVSSCAASGGARHCGAPMLSRYAATSALLRSMASLSAVLPNMLQGR
jgi:hypothetical protein